MWVWVLIVLVVIGGLVYITINKKVENTTEPTEQVQVEQEQPLGEVEQNKNSMENTQKEEGVKITILKEGTGDVAKAGDTVAMNYTGTFLDGKAFDSNIDPKFNHVEPFVFTLGAGQVIKGWDVGVAGMKVGEKRKLEIKSEFAYGERGAGGAIPPNTDLVFEVELLGIKK
jgi:FKBP-type peptidyl-prolyl cis-trans isomerase